MGLVYADLVQETSTTTGTGPLSLSLLAGFRRFANVMSVADTCYYVINSGNEYEVGLGTYSAANQLTRTTVLVSSNANAALNLAAGTKRVTLTVSGSKIADLDKRVYTATFSASSGATINPATHQLGTADDLTVSIYRSDGTEVWVKKSVAAGVVTWSAAEAFDGKIVIQR